MLDLLSRSLERERRRSLPLSRSRLRLRSRLLLPRELRSLYRSESRLLLFDESSRWYSIAREVEARDGGGEADWRREERPEGGREGGD